MRFWIVTSSADVGSSATRSFGCGSTASPISTRCSIPPGELVRVGVVDASRVGAARPGRTCRGCGSALSARPVELDERRGLVRLAADRAHRVERVRGVLRHEADLASAQRPERALGQAERSRARRTGRSPCAVPPAGQQPQHRPGDRRLARTRTRRSARGSRRADREPTSRRRPASLPVGDGQALRPAAAAVAVGGAGVRHHGGLLPGLACALRRSCAASG